MMMMIEIAGKEAEETQQGCMINAAVCCSFFTHPFIAARSQQVQKWTGKGIRTV